MTPDEIAKLPTPRTKALVRHLDSTVSGSHKPWGLTMQAHAERQEQAIAALRAQVAKTTNALENLFALVEGECPSLLEDDHHASMTEDAINSAGAILSAVREHLGES